MPFEAPCENPVVCRLFRGDRLEAQHRAAFAVVRGGAVVRRAGETRRGCFMRSASKFFQAVPTLVLGAEERFRLGDREIALMCASHGGEPEHVVVAAGLLERGGLTMGDLHCGAHAPLHAPSAFRLRAAGERPTKLHNNCSGKHAGMMLGAIAIGASPLDYFDPEHPIQKRIIEFMLELSGIDRSELGVMTDGCGAPTFFLPLEAAARAYSRFATPGSLSPAVDRVAARIFSALAAEPRMIAGQDRFCTGLLAATRGRIVGKVGADGFYGAMCRATGTGLALHLDDGSSPMSERLMLALLEAEGLVLPAEILELRRFAEPLRKNHAGLVVGRVHVELSSDGQILPTPIVNGETR